MKNKARQLAVCMNGILVGHLEKSPRTGLSFYYADSWLNHIQSRPLSLAMPIRKKKYQGDIVYNFFDNLLPDNPHIRARLQARFQTPTDQPFDLLASIGKDCIGAIQLIDGNQIPENRSIQAEVLNDNQIASILKSYQINPLGMNDDSDFRISLAGAQEKSAFLWHYDQWCRPHGSTPTSHIFKLPIGTIAHQGLDLSNSCENEWLCAQILRAYNLPVAKCSINYFDDVKVLVVERFDRKYAAENTWLMRLHQEDMCQALGFSPNLKYQADGGPGIQQIMQLLLGSQQPLVDRRNFFKAQVLFWCLAAIDGHAKNFSVTIKRQGDYQLTPLYDVISAYPMINSHQLQYQKIKMAMA